MVAERIRPSTAILKYIVENPSIKHIVFVEEGARSGGVGMNLLSDLARLGRLSDLRFDLVAIDNSFASPDEPIDLYDYVGLSANKLTRYFLD